MVPRTVSTVPGFSPLSDILSDRSRPRNEIRLDGHLGDSFVFHCDDGDVYMLGRTAAFDATSYTVLNATATNTCEACGALLSFLPNASPGNYVVICTNGDKVTMSYDPGRFERDRAFARAFANN